MRPAEERLLSDDVVIRLVMRDDGPALAALMEQLGYATSATAMQDRLRMIHAQELYHTLIAAKDGRVVGMIGVRRGLWYERNGCYGQIAALVVDHASRRQGIGTALMMAGEQWLHRHGARVVILFSGATRAVAHAFYAQFGYHEVLTERFFVKEDYNDGQDERAPEP